MRVKLSGEMNKKAKNTIKRQTTSIEKREEARGTEARTGLEKFILWSTDYDIYKYNDDNTYFCSTKSFFNLFFCMLSFL